MVLASPHGESGPPTHEERGAREVIWHDLECGRYHADLHLWRELAASVTPALNDPILDIGAGTGRVALDLARAGHSVTALELDPDLLAALTERAASTTVESIQADARTFELSSGGFALCLVPMQTVQLLGGAGARAAFLGRAHAHLRAGGLLACAIVTELDAFDCDAGDAGPSAEIARVDGDLYISSATSVRVRRRCIRIERERQILPAGHAIAPRQALRERNVVELDRLTASELQNEALAVGFTPDPPRTVDATEDHVGSVVVMLRA